MVTRLLRLDAMPKPADAADALALAICHVWRGGAQHRLAEAVAKRQGGPRRPAPTRRQDGPQASDRVGRPDRWPRSPRTGRSSRSAGSACSSTARPARSPRSGWASRRALATSLVVREESLTLYGFATDDERTVFELLQTASGVGPKLALAMLAVHTPNALRVAVATEDLKALTRVPGIGQKGAQRIVLELKDRLGTPEEAVDAALNGGRRVGRWRDQVHAGLVGSRLDSARTRTRPIAAVDAGGRRPGYLAAGRRRCSRWRCAMLKSALRRARSVAMSYERELVSPAAEGDEKGDRGRAAAQAAGRSSSARRGCASSCRWSWRARCGAAGRRTTC